MSNVANVKTSRAVIRISRDERVEANSNVAIRILDMYTHVIGQIVMIRYYADPGTNTLVDNMVAVGIKDGIGHDCYQLLTTFHKTVIWGVVTDPSEVDAGKFVTGREKYIYIDPETKKCKYVIYNAESDERQFIPITDGPRAYEDIATGRTIYIDAYGSYSGGGSGIDPQEIEEIVSALIDTKIRNNNNNYYDKTTIDGMLDGKVDKDQGIANAGKYLTVGVNGMVQVTPFELNWVEE